MSIEKITSKIISDAEAAAKVTLDENQVRCDGILAEAKAQAQRIEAEASETGRAEKEKLISRRKAVADIDSRKIVLEEKQKMIAACFDRAVEKITSMEPADYVAFMVKQLQETGETAGALILNPKDRASIGETLVQAAAKEIAGSRITLSEETRNIQGGFLLKKDNVYINGTVEALVEEARDALSGEVAARLFQ